MRPHARVLKRGLDHKHNSSADFGFESYKRAKIANVSELDKRRCRMPTADKGQEKEKMRTSWFMRDNVVRPS